MQKNDMVSELKKICDIKLREGKNIPIPKFFFVQRYGRTIEEQMLEILPYINKKEWFLFKAGERFKEGDVLQNLRIELEKRAKVGKDYEECVIIELTESIVQKEEFIELLEYLKLREEKMYFLFTMKQSKNTASIQRCVEQYFFIRTIHAEAYTTKEQLEIIKKNCEAYQFKLEKKTEDLLLEGLEKREWEIEECISAKLENKVSSVLYEAILESADKTSFVTSEMAEQILEGLEKELTKKATIGFRQGGYVCE